jgi:CubicO group peptidase (beta-lactamase class C family)
MKSYAELSSVRFAAHRSIVRVVAVVMMVLTVAGCGQSEPTATPVPATATRIALEPTRTPRPPTATPAPPMATRVLIPQIAAIVAPTASASPTASPTRTPIPTLTPYDKIPEQTDDGWEVASLAEAGIDPIRISRMLRFIYHGDRSGDTLTLPNGARKYEQIHSILIVKDGRLVFEEYFYYYSRGSSHDLASATKSITSLLVGSAIAQGYLGGVDEEILPFFPEYLPLQEPGTGAETITIEDLLTMRTGWECDDWDPASRTYYMKPHPDDPDSIRAILNFPMETLPGSYFSYCTSGTAVLNAMIARASGAGLAQFANRALLKPLGIQGVVWDTSFGGFGGILLMRPRDMAKIGLLALQNGSWQGEQIIPEEWIRQSVQEHVALPFNDSWGNGYGYLWWLSDVQIGRTWVHSFAASGHGGQVIAVFPELNMVVVITGGNYEDDEGQPFQIMEKFILPAVLGH